MIWVATYSDGTVFPEYDNRIVHAFKEIDFHRLVKLGWHGERCYEVHVKPGEEVVAFRRHEIKLGGEDTIIHYGLGIMGKFTMLIDGHGNVEVE